MRTNAERLNFYEVEDGTDHSRGRNILREQIVRCKDCKWQIGLGCKQTYTNVKPDHFCGYGERNE